MWKAVAVVALFMTLALLSLPSWEETLHQSGATRIMDSPEGLPCALFLHTATVVCYNTAYEAQYLLRGTKCSPLGGECPPISF